MFLHNRLLMAILAGHICTTAWGSVVDAGASDSAIEGGAGMMLENDAMDEWSGSSIWSPLPSHS
jgi:hypothetical protein